MFMAKHREHITNNTDITFEQTYIHFEKRVENLIKFEYIKCINN